MSSQLQENELRRRNRQEEDEIDPNLIEERLSSRNIKFIEMAEWEHMPPHQRTKLSVDTALIWYKERSNRQFINLRDEINTMKRAGYNSKQEVIEKLRNNLDLVPVTDKDALQALLSAPETDPLKYENCLKDYDNNGTEVRLKEFLQSRWYVSGLVNVMDKEKFLTWERYLESNQRKIFLSMMSSPVGKKLLDNLLDDRVVRGVGNLRTIYNCLIDIDDYVRSGDVDKGLYIIDNYPEAIGIIIEPGFWQNIRKDFDDVRAKNSNYCTNLHHFDKFVSELESQCLVTDDRFFSAFFTTDPLYLSLKPRAGLGVYPRATSPYTGGAVAHYHDAFGVRNIPELL